MCTSKSAYSLIVSSILGLVLVDRRRSGLSLSLVLVVGCWLIVDSSPLPWSLVIVIVGTRVSIIT
jgi:hypothetical protein